ncbi:MAG: glutamate--tRNA ligase [Bacteroidetes bacterium]|nr:glutamate--tRNA ligase [Bacteroidota bacterium]
MRVRFAPSPTGYLHIGGLRTALYNFLLAKRHGGTFLLRIEDTDQTRFVEDAEQDIFDSLTWAGISFDEGPGKGGSFGPYHQSARSARYKDVADQLIGLGKAYVAFDSSGEIEALKEKLTSLENPNPRYDYATRSEMTNSLTLSKEETVLRMGRGDEYVVRLLVHPGKEVSFIDAVRGQVTFVSDAVDDQVLIKSDGLPTYHLANIVDDHDMEITHVIRGEEWLSSTPKHILLYDALGWTAPQMAHLPLILSPSGGKLSKRNAESEGIPVSVKQYRDKGYEPEALVNFLALLGWNPGTDQELMTVDEMAAAFSLDRVGQAGVQFDLQKLAWFNEQYLRGRSPLSIAQTIYPAAADRYPGVSLEFVAGAVSLMLERLSFASDVLDAAYLFEDPNSFDETAVAKRWKENSGPLCASFSKKLGTISPWTAESLQVCLKEFVEENGIGIGEIMFPARMALSGLPSGPDLYAMMALLGVDSVQRRLLRASTSIGV